MTVVIPVRDDPGGLEDTFVVLEGRLSPEHGRSATRELLAEPKPPTAIVTGGNQILLGAIEEIHDRGLALGSELSLVSCDTVSLTGRLQAQTEVLGRSHGRMVAGQPKPVTCPIVKAC